jgi:hypothetical protein
MFTGRWWEIQREIVNWEDLELYENVILKVA